MAQIPNGRADSHLHGQMVDESRCQLAGMRIRADDSSYPLGAYQNNNNGYHHQQQQQQQQQQHQQEQYHHMTNGSLSEDRISDAITNFGLSPRPVSAHYPLSSSSSSTTSSPASKPSALPTVAPKPSKSSKKEHLNHRVRSKSSGSVMGRATASSLPPSSMPMGTGDASRSSDSGRTNGQAGHGDGRGRGHAHSDESRTLRFVGKRGLSIGGDDITSTKGTVRGVTNRVKAGIMNFTFKPLNHKKKSVNNDDERDKIIIYTTSMRVVRETFEDCQFVRKLFQNHRVHYEERDLFMNADNQQELRDRLEGDTQQVTLPIVFIDGELVGDVEKLEDLNESGQLKKILDRFEKTVPTSNCPECGGFRYVPCQVCNGSKKSMLRNNFTDQFMALRCSNCDDNGLQRCTQCNK